MKIRTNRTEWTVCSSNMWTNRILVTNIILKRIFGAEQPWEELFSMSNGEQQPLNDHQAHTCTLPCSFQKRYCPPEFFCLPINTTLIIKIENDNWNKWYVYGRKLNWSVEVTLHVTHLLSFHIFSFELFGAVKSTKMKKKEL